MIISSHVAINCKNLLVSEQFYASYFGFKRARVIELGDGQIIFIKSGSTYLELFQSNSESPLAPFTGDGPAFPGLRHIAFQVESVDKKLAEMGANAHITLGPLDFNDFISGWRSVWVTDPDGNIVEISQGFSDQ